MVAAWYYLHGIKNVAVGLKKFAVQRIFEDGITFQSVFTISNPSGISFSPKFLHGDLYLNSAKIGSVDQTFTGKIAAKAITSVPISMLFHYDRIADGIKALINAGDYKSINIRFVGTLTIGIANIPVDISKPWNEVVG